ncbi:hypothetical protein, partial [Streptomyces sp. N35]|uniref:hypothetical protein n=1 Tax=Streptomyces sp. N35 TaxID=2795730 RepID=UPI001F38B7D4
QDHPRGSWPPAAVRGSGPGLKLLTSSETQPDRVRFSRGSIEFRTGALGELGASGPGDGITHPVAHF